MLFFCVLNEDSSMMIGCVRDATSFCITAITHHQFPSRHHREWPVMILHSPQEFRVISVTQDRQGMQGFYTKVSDNCVLKPPLRHQFPSPKCSTKRECPTRVTHPRPIGQMMMSLLHNDHPILRGRRASYYD